VQGALTDGDARTGGPGKEDGVPTTDLDRAHLALGEQESIHLLRTATIGRVAYSHAALPAIRAVSYTVRDGVVVIPARVRSALAQATRGAVVAFEADSYDPAARTGWSVTVVGPSRVVAGPRPEDPDVCLIVVQLGLVRGWRTTLSSRADDTAEPVHDTCV
jgi:uncharacterized protein